MATNNDYRTLQRILDLQNFITEHGQKAPTYRLYFKQYAEVELCRGEQEEDPTFSQDVNCVIGFEFQSENIISKYNDFIDYANITYETSLSHVTNINELCSSLKTIISGFIALNWDSSRIYAGIGQLILCLSLKDNITIAQFFNDDDMRYYSFENIYGIHMFGTTEGYWDTETIYYWENYYASVATLFGWVVPVFIAVASSLGYYIAPFVTTTNQGVTLNKVKLSLVDDYDLICERI